MKKMNYTADYCFANGLLPSTLSTEQSQNLTFGYKKLWSKKDTKDWFIAQKQLIKGKEEQNPASIYALICAFEYLTMDEIKSIFPGKNLITDQNLFDHKYALKEDAPKNLDTVVLSIFKTDNLEKSGPKRFKNDLEFLQKMFFFLLWKIAGENKNSIGAKKYSELLQDFYNSIQNKTWFTPEKQALLIEKMVPEFKKSLRNEENTFEPVDFTQLPDKTFDSNECVLRILYNFSRPKAAVKEGIISELNFVREQQKNILPVFPNTYRTDYTEADGDLEIKKVKANKKILQKIDFGFNIADFKQGYYLNDESNKKEIIRPVKCLCFEETNMDFETLKYRNGRINAHKNFRIANENCLYTKYLYPERNKITHMGESSGVFRLFSKEYRDSEIKNWCKLVIDSMYDIRKYLINKIEKGYEEFAQSKLRILNSYFERIIEPLNKKNLSGDELWNHFFINNHSNIVDSDFEKTNIANIFAKEPDELDFFHHFVSFMYLSQNETEDFLIKNKYKIQVYLLRLSLELCKKDKKSQKN